MCFFTFSEVRVMLLRGAAALRNKVEDEVQVPTRSLQGHPGQHQQCPQGLSEMDKHTIIRDDICHKHTSSACVKLFSLG